MRLPLAGLLVALLLAGCFQADDAPVEEGDPASAAAAGETAKAGEEAQPNDDGTRPEAVTDTGHSPHMHDYWKGKERVVLYDDAVEPSGDPFAAFEPTFFGREPKVGRTYWTLPNESIIYEGTGQVDFTATWADPAVTSLAMRYRPNTNAEWSDPVALPQGETVSIPITPDMTDMPHMKVSRWSFAFEPAEPGAAMGPFDLKVEIVKVADIMMFPAHPLLFNGLPEKTLHDLDHEHTEVSYAKRVPNLVTAGEFGEKTVKLADLVPMETQAIRIEVDILEATSTPGVVADIRFFYHGADTNYLGHPYVMPYEGSLAEKRLVYQIPVTMEMTDSPYAPESQWLFFVEPTSKFVGDENEPDCGGCADVSVKYHMTVIAYDHPLDGYSKMEGDE